MPHRKPQIETCWLKGRAHWKDEHHKPWLAHWERSEEVRKLEEIAEADYCSKMLHSMEGQSVQIGGNRIPIPTVNLSGDEPDMVWEQSLFTDADAIASLHPKVRRLIRAEITPHSDTAKMRSGAKA